MKTQKTSHFWSKTYSVSSHAITFNFYFGSDVNTSQINEVLQAVREDLLSLNVDPCFCFETLCSTNAGLCIQCKFAFRDSSTRLARLRLKLANAQWKESK